MTSEEVVLASKASKKANKSPQVPSEARLNIGDNMLMPLAGDELKVNSSTQLEHFLAEFGLFMRNLLKKEKEKTSSFYSGLSQELREEKEKLKMAQNNEKRLLLKVALLKESLSQHGEIIRTVAQKLVTSEGFSKYISKATQIAHDYVRSHTLEVVGQAYDILTRRKALDWHPQAKEKMRRDYTKMVLEGIPEFPLITHIYEQGCLLTLKEVGNLNVDIDTSLAEDTQLVISDDFRDLYAENSSEDEKTGEGENDHDIIRHRLPRRLGRRCNGISRRPCRYPHKSAPS